MDKRSKALFNDDILIKALELYNFEGCETKSLDGFESFIYEIVERGVILRITHSLHRSKEQICGEIDWINYLKKGGIPVTTAYRSIDGNYVEKIEIDNSYFLVSAFEKLKGSHIIGDQRDEKIYYQLGKILGRSHKLTKSFKFTDSSYTRGYWGEEDYNLLNFIPKEESRLIDKVRSILDEVSNLPKDKDSYGLIHTDAHFGNMFGDKGEISLFDFDDSEYMWFISDIAIVLFYSIMSPYKNYTQEQFTDHIMDNLLRGYREENEISDYWIEKLPLFLKLREVTLFMVICRSFDIENLEDPWCKWYMDGRKEKILKDLPYIDFDFKRYKTQD